MTNVRQYKVYADIRAGCTLERERHTVKRQWGCQKRQFSVLSFALEALEVRAKLLCSII